MIGVIISFRGLNTKIRVNKFRNPQTNHRNVLNSQDFWNTSEGTVVTCRVLFLTVTLQVSFKLYK